MRVAIFLAVDLGGGDLIDQRLRAGDELPCLEREVGLVDLGLELVHVLEQSVGDLLDRLRVVVGLGVGGIFGCDLSFGATDLRRLRGPQVPLDAVEAGEVDGAALGVIPAHVDGGIEFGEGLGDRLDALVEGAHLAELVAGGVEIAALDRGDELFGLRGQSVDLAAHVIEVAGLGGVDVGGSL